MKNWCISSNLRNFDVVGALEKLKKIYWKRTTHFNNVKVEDIVYFYISAPEGDIRAKCKVTNEAVDKEDFGDEILSYFTEDSAKNKYLEGDNRYIELELLEIYGKGIITLELLKSEVEWKNPPQTICSISDEMVSFIEKVANNKEMVDNAKIADNIEIANNIKMRCQDYLVHIERDSSDDGYTEEILATILKGMYNSADACDNQKKTTALHMFGIKYGDVINGGNFVVTRIVEKAGLASSYHAEVSKGIRILDSAKSGLFGVTISNCTGIATVGEEPSRNTELPDLSPRANQYHLNTILYGAPGTGKTYALTKKAVAIIENSTEEELSSGNRADLIKRQNGYMSQGRIVFTTFHQSYSYEDFIQGLRPVTGSDGSVSFKEIDGVFKKIADRALNDGKNNYVIVIDEINRANISKVFGELITLIEEDKRWGEANGMSVTLPSGDIFAVPNNLYIIGTMNSSDKSIALIDAALRRRFSFEEKVPDYSLLSGKSKEILQRLNARLREELKSSDLLIGHAYFINKGTEGEIVHVLNESVIPLLYEYFYDDEEKVKSVLASALLESGIAIVGKTDNVGRVKVHLEAE